VGGRNQLGFLGDDEGDDEVNDCSLNFRMESSHGRPRNICEKQQRNF